MAKYVDKSSLEEKITEKIANEWLKKLGLNTSVLTIPGEIRATTFLETETKDGEKIFIQFDIKLIDFNFGNSGMPTMAFGSGAATVYSKEGENLDSSIILPAYADVCAFCEQLQKVAKNTIFDGSKKFLGIFGVSADSTAEALSSQMMTKLLNSKYTKDVFKMIDAKEMKSALKTVSSKALSYGTKKIYKLVTKPSKKRTEVSVKCPVDIKVYDNDGKLCGIISNNEVDNTYSDIYMTVVGDQKNIYLVGDDYTFELTGTDVGTMDYYVKEFDENGIEIRKISYENIALNNGSKYYSYVPESENLSSILFDLTDVDGNGISPTYGADKDYEEEKTEIIANGVCGENLTWSLDRDGVLQIKGTGDMYDYENYEEPLNPTPWKSYRIKSVLVDDGVTSIGNDAFYDCRSLCHVDISDTVTHIGSYAFALCYSLKSVVIPDSVNFLGKSAFFTNNIVQGLKRIVMQGSAPIVEDDAFGYVFAELIIPPNASGYDKKPWVQMAICSEGQTYGKCGDGLTWKLDEDGVLTVEGSGPMYYYYYSSPGVGSYQAQLPPWDIVSKQVKEIVFNAENSQIGSYAFYNCKTVTEVSIGYGVTSIGDNAFSYCNSLERINIPEGITSIDRYAFGWCSSLKTVNIPESAINIESGAFCGCSSLESINLPKGMGDIASYIFNDCSSLKTVNIPEGVTYIKDSAFYGCSNLKNIIIPRGVKSIWKEAFCNCSSLVKVTIPPSVTDIYEHAFYSYDSSGFSPLKNLTIYGVADSYAETYAKENGFPYVYENISDDDIQGTDLLQAKEELQKLCKGDMLSFRVDMGHYLSDAQMDILERCIFTWLAQINNVDEYVDISNKHEVMDKLGINMNADFSSGDEKAIMHIISDTTYGRKTISFTLDIGKVENKKELYKAFGKIHYEILEKDNIPNDVPVQGKFGMESYASMDQFIENVLGTAKTSLSNKIKTNDDKKSVCVLVDKIIMDVVGNDQVSFSNGVFTLFSKPIKNYTKKVIISCPVDVYIYNMDGNVCGSIINNVVDVDSVDIKLSVEDDTKILYLAGGDHFIEIKSTGTGSMGYVIEELDENLNTVRKVNFPDLSLATDRIYKGYILEGLYIDQVLYSLESDDSKIVYAREDTYHLPFEKITGIMLNTSNASVSKDKEIQLKATIYPELATNKNLQWISDNEAVATVNDNGLVSAVGVGTAVITVKSMDGSYVTASCVVDVTKISDGKPVQGEDIGGNNGDTPGGDSSGGDGSSSGGNSSSGDSSSSGGNSGSGNDSSSGDSLNNGNSSDKNSDDELQVSLLYYIVEFNANGGTKLSRKTMTLLNDDNLGILPKVQLKNFTFNGWYTQKNGGTKVSSSTVLNAGTTLFAQWTKVDKPSKVKATSLKSKKAGQLVVSFKKITGAKGYEIAYSTNKKLPSSSTKKIVSVSPKKTLKKLKSGRKYYVRIRAYKVDSTGKKVYGAYSKAKSIKVK